MNQIDAIYQNGVFKPLGDAGLRENARERLTVELAVRRDLSG
jgi:predicted DNA-binding antitoxin AbrB/MazE fold protein